MALALAAQGSVSSSPLLWASALAALGAACLTVAPAALDRWSGLAVAVCLLAGWMAATNRWLSPSYTAAAAFHSAFLLAGFLFGRRSGLRGLVPAAHAAGIFAAALAAWSLWQGFGGDRGHALFETPATLAAVLNLVLAPCLVLVLAGDRRPFMIAAVVLLLAGVAASASRSGWLALGGSLLFALVLARRLAVRVDQRLLVLAGALFALALFAAGATAFLASGSSLARLELYDLAWSAALEPSTLVHGIGYGGFVHVLESGKAGVFDYDHAGAGTYFVHNDYLQVLLELGVPGLLGLLAITLGPPVLVWRTPDAKGRIALVAACASLAAMASHALMDFPFYVPVCLAMYGFMLGVVDSAVSRAEPVGRSRTRRAAGAAAATIGVWLLAMPVAAEAAAWRAQHAWARGDGGGAAYWFEAARALEPRDWRFHWYAGQFWFSQAMMSGKPEAARRSIDAFARGSAVNPRESRNVRAADAARRRLAPLLEPGSEAR